MRTFSIRIREAIGHKDIEGRIKKGSSFENRIIREASKHFHCLTYVTCKSDSYSEDGTQQFSGLVATTKGMVLGSYSAILNREGK